MPDIYKLNVSVQRVILLIIALLFSCAAPKRATDLLITKESYCDPPQGMFKYNAPISHNSDSVLAANQQLTRSYSVSSILMMYALGIVEDVKQLQELQNNATDHVRELQLRRRINDKILLANAEISSVAAELDCEGERIDQIAKYVDDMNTKRNTKFTVTSIVVGALAGAAGALVTNSGWNKGIAISAGAAGIGLGLATLNPKGRKIDIQHQRNLLRDVWLQQNNYDIPAFVWFMLTEKRISNSGEASLLDNLKRRWIKYQFDDKEKEAKQSVNFTDGGTYRADDLHNRAEMINQLQAEIRSLAQPLNIFLRELQENERNSDY